MVKPVTRWQTVNSSAFYEILLWLSSWYALFFYLAEIFMYIYKGEVLQFIDGRLAGELFTLLGIACADRGRILLGSWGNLAESPPHVVGSILLTVLTAVGGCWLILWQTYCLYFEFIVVLLWLVLQGIDVIFAIVAIVMFSKD